MSAAPDLSPVKREAVAWFTRQRGGLTDAEGRELRRYVAVERFSILGRLRYDNRLRVTQTGTQPGRQLVMEVLSSARVTVRFVFDFAPTDAGSLVTATVTLRMPTL